MLYYTKQRKSHQYINVALDMSVCTYDEMPLALTTHVCSSPSNTLTYNRVHHKIVELDINDDLPF